ncbi:MAG: hypothetical protein QNJ47_19275 [Nostocaceae cyanobacterium]|nr:hypothetical protein [Nostocaceae cyanobacterium]
MEINPYDVLEISADATNKDISKAFAMAMKRRKYPPEEIAKARRSLMNPQERILADYLRPIVPEIAEFQRQEFANREVLADTIDLLPEFDGLEGAIAHENEVTEVDRRIGLSLIDFFKQ